MHQSSHRLTTLLFQYPAHYLDIVRILALHCLRAYSKEFFVVHNFKSSCMLKCTNSIQSNNKLEQTSWNQHYLLINLCLTINATGNPGCTLFNSECTISAGNTLRLGPALPCNLLVRTCFLTVMFHKVVREYMQGVVGLLMTSLLQIHRRIFEWKKNWKSVNIWQNHGHEFVTHPVLIDVAAHPVVTDVSSVYACPVQQRCN